MAGERGGKVTARRQQGDDKATEIQRQLAMAQAQTRLIELVVRAQECVFISTPSFLVEANVDTSAMQLGSDDDSRHDITVVNLEEMDWEGGR